MTSRSSHQLSPQREFILITDQHKHKHIEQCLHDGRCDNITISPGLLGELEASHDPLPRKLWPRMGTKGQARIAMTGDQEPTFRKMHGDDQMAVDKLQEGIDGFAKDQASLESLIAKIKG